MNNRPLGCSGFYLSLLSYSFTLELFKLGIKKSLELLLVWLLEFCSWLKHLSAFLSIKSIISWKPCDYRLLSTNVTCRLTIIDKYRVLSTYRLRFRWSTLICMYVRPVFFVLVLSYSYRGKRFLKLKTNLTLPHDFLRLVPNFLILIQSSRLNEMTSFPEVEP